MKLHTQLMMEDGLNKNIYLSDESYRTFIINIETMIHLKVGENSQNVKKSVAIKQIILIPSISLKVFRQSYLLCLSILLLMIELLKLREKKKQKDLNLIVRI